MYPVTELSCENIQYVEFPINVEDFYFFEVNEFSDVVITNTDVFCSLCCELFLSFHSSVVVVVTIGCNGDFNVVQV